MDRAVVSLCSTTTTVAFGAGSLLLRGHPTSQHCYSPNHSSSSVASPLPYRSTKLRAKLGGEDGGGLKQPGSDKRKFITREQEPEQYWQTAGEREGENPMKTPLPYIILFGMSTPFVILAIAFASGWIKAPIIR